jgi:hypothetical protein
VTSLPIEERPMYVVITFYSEYPEGARRIDSFKLQGYKISFVIFKKGNILPDFILLSVIGDKILCLITEKRMEGLTLEPLLYEKQGTLLETIEKVEHSGISILSHDIIAILYELESGISRLSSEEIRPISHVSIRNFNSMMKRKKKEFRDSVMAKFIDKYSELERYLELKPELRNAIIFRVLEFIRLSTGSIDPESYSGVITEYLFVKGDPRGSKISVVPFIEKVVNNFFRIEFDLTLDKKSIREIWDDIAEETDIYTVYPPMDAKGSLRNAIENTMTLFTVTLHNTFPFKELQERVHCDFILATIYLIKRLWKVYDRCIAVIKLLLEKDTTPDEKKRLLHYLLLKFNKLIYVKCYFASFSSNSNTNQILEQKRTELEKSLKAYKLEDV